MCIPDPLAFENGQLRRWKPFGLALEEVAGRSLLVAGSHTIFTLYGARAGMGSDLKIAAAVCLVETLEAASSSPGAVP